jgi:hypothetical protein
MDFNELEAVMERFLWQSYAQHLQNTLFHSERIAPLRKKTLQERLDHAYEFKARGDERVAANKYREAQTQYEVTSNAPKRMPRVRMPPRRCCDTQRGGIRTRSYSPATWPFFAVRLRPLQVLRQGRS